LIGDEETAISRRTIQKLLIPLDYSALMEEYRQRIANFQQVESDFLVVLDKIDNAVYEMFGLSEEEKAQIEKRLSNFPLNQLPPRYPWDNVRSRPIKAYTEDRFA
jgi:hypothetical protein